MKSDWHISRESSFANSQTHGAHLSLILFELLPGPDEMLSDATTTANLREFATNKKDLAFKSKADA